MGRKSPKAKTKTVLKSVSKMQQLGSIQNLKFQTLSNKNHPNIHIHNKMIGTAVKPEQLQRPSGFSLDLPAQSAAVSP